MGEFGEEEIEMKSGKIKKRSALEKIYDLEARTLVQIIDGMLFGGLKELEENLLKPDPRPWLTGDLDVSNVLKLIAVALRYKANIGPKLLRALFQYDAYIL